MPSGRYMGGRPTSAPGTTNDDDESHRASKNYASFLKETERKCGPDGFLDSTRYTSRMMQKRQKQETRSLDVLPNARVLDISTSRIEYEKDYEKRLKAIEDSMFKAKKEEREYERFKRDCMKKQRDVSQKMKSVEQETAKASFEEEKKLSKCLEKYTTLQRNFTRRKVEHSHNRTEANRTFLQAEKDGGRSAQLTNMQLLKKYREKMDALHLCKTEADRLVREYETKLRLLETKELGLTKETMNIANSIHRENLKSKQVVVQHEQGKKTYRDTNIKEDLNSEKTVEKELTRGDGDVKAADMKKRRLSANLNTMRGRMAIKKREEDRTLQHTRIRLQDNTNVQRRLNRETKEAQADFRTKEMQQKIEEANARRISASTARQLDRKVKNTNQETFFSERAKDRHLDTQRSQYEDGMRHFKRSVTYGENLEHQLHTQVKRAEYERQKNEQEFRKRQNELNAIKKANAQRLTIEIADANRKEKELEEKMIRIKAELDKAHAQREESYCALMKHRQSLSEEKHLLKYYVKENERLQTIGNISDALTS